MRNVILLKIRVLKILSVCILAVSAVFATFSAQANVDVKFIEGKKFSDYQLTSYNRVKSLEMLQQDFQKLFSKLSVKKMDEQQLLEIDVTNIDLPGIIRYNFGRSSEDMRVIESNTPFKLYFTYKVKTKNGDVVREGEFKLREFSDSNSNIHKSRLRGSVGYYERPLKKWFAKEFSTKK